MAAKMMQPPTKLASKVTKGGQVDPADAIAKADAIVQNVAKEFEAGLDSEFAELDKLFEKYKASDDADDLDAVFRRIHNLRGQGTTLGFPLISRIGSSFCRYMIERDQSAPINKPLVEQHLAALRCVYTQHIEDAGDELSQQVAASLEKAVDQFLDTE
jgi:chemotaxis protein histidine kinase CheA